jgi:hypothetical protein
MCVYVSKGFLYMEMVNKQSGRGFMKAKQVYQREEKGSGESIFEWVQLFFNSCLLQVTSGLLWAVCCENVVV